MSNTTSFLNHLTILRRVFIAGVVVQIILFSITVYFYEYVFNFLYVPFSKMNQFENTDAFFVNTLTEGFMAKISLSFLVSFIVALPFHVSNALWFIYPALHKKEKRIISIFLFFSMCFLVFGFYYGYNLIIPASLKFLIGTGFIPKNVGILLNYEKTLSLTLKFIITMMLVFQIPIIILLLLFFKIISRKILWKKSKFFIVIVFIFSAIITPPDVLSQLSIALPLIILYYLSLIVASIFKIGGAPCSE